MSDSDEWASASDSELQDTEIEPVRTANLSDNLPQPDDKTSLSKPVSVCNADRGSQESGKELRGENCKVKHTDNSPSEEQPLPPPYETNTRALEENEILSKEDTPQVRGDQTDTPASSWGSWGSNWLSKAANSVASSAHSLASNTEIGISSLVNSVESQFGIPTPESMASRDVVEKKESDVTDAAVSLKELAQRLKEEQTDTTQVGNDNIPKETSNLSGDKAENTEPVDESSSFFSGYGMSLTNKLVSGGLDTLENIGKKTMGMISEGDPGLRNKRAFVQEKIEILTKETVTEIDTDTPTLTSFHSEFERLQGYVYLEALEILSSECERKQRLRMHSVSARSQEGATPGQS